MSTPRAPNNNPLFVARWNQFIDDVMKRENYRPGHLNQLAILCDLYVEYENLKNQLEMTGNTYESYGRNGLQIKMKPEVAQKSKVVDQIAQYSKMLGLLLEKDKGDTGQGNSFDV